MSNGTETKWSIQDFAPMIGSALMCGGLAWWVYKKTSQIKEMQTDAELTERVDKIEEEMSVREKMLSLYDQKIDSLETDNMKLVETVSDHHKLLVEHHSAIQSLIGSLSIPETPASCDGPSEPQSNVEEDDLEAELALLDEEDKKKQEEDLGEWSDLEDLEGQD